MAVDFSILQRTPTIGSRIMAGQQMAREQALQNRLLARQDLQFQQQQEDRARQLQQTQQQEAIFKQASDMIRQAGLDPDDPQVLQQFTAAAVQSRQPQLISLAGAMTERAAKRKQQQAEADALQAALTGRPMGARAAAPAAAPVAPAAMAQPSAAPAITATTFDEGAARPEMPRPSITARTAAVEPPMPMGPVRELPPPSTLIGAAPAVQPANALAPPSAAPAANRLAAAADPNAERIAELEAKRDRLEMLGTTKGATLAAQTQRQIDKLRGPAATASEREYQLAKQQGFEGSFIEYKQALRPQTNVKVNLPRQEDEFEKKLGGGQAEKVLKDRDAAEEAASIIGTVQRGQELLSGPIITGFGAEFLTQFGSALNQIGFSVAKDAVANTQAFAANMAQNVGKIIKQFGAGTGLSNADREYAEKMAGGKITLDKAALAKILDINERAARNVIQAHNKRVAGIKTNLPLTVEMPAARGRVGGEATSVTLPDGRVMNFPDAAAAAAFKKAAGL